jgi:hypothetical protein
MPDENAGKALLPSVGMLLHISQDNDVVEQRGGLPMKLTDPISVGTTVLLKLRPERFTRLSDLMPVIEDLYCLLQPNRNEQADDDRGNVDEEALPRVDVLVKSVNIEHWR